MSKNIFDMLIDTVINSAYVIVHNRDDKEEWFLYDIDNRKSVKQVIWTKRKENAIHCTTEKEAIDIKNKYLRNYVTGIKQLKEN